MTQDEINALVGELRIMARNHRHVFAPSHHADLIDQAAQAITDLSAEVESLTRVQGTIDRHVETICAERDQLRAQLDEAVGFAETVANIADDTTIEERDALGGISANARAFLAQHKEIE